MVLPGQASLRRLIHLTMGVSKPHYFIRITKEAREDCTCGQISLPTSTGVPSSRQNNQFAQKYSISEQFPVRVSNLALFIAYLVNQSYKPSTISSYVSAIGYVNKLKAIPDPTSSFLILKLLRAAISSRNLLTLVCPLWSQCWNVSCAHWCTQAQIITASTSSKQCLLLPSMPSWELDKLQPEEKIGTMLI